MINVHYEQTEKNGETIGILVEFSPGSGGVELGIVARELEEKLPFTIEMPCGKTYPMTEAHEFPTENMPCHCGEPGHYFVKYEKVEA